jgi:hypothetical protein
MGLPSYLNPLPFFRLLPGTSLLFILLLISVAVFAIARSLRILWELRALPGLGSTELPVEAIHLRLQHMRHRMSNLRRTLLMTLYLFGCCLFLQMFISFQAIGMSGRPLVISIANDLSIASVFATDVFLVFFSLNLLEWWVTSRVNRAVVLSSRL